MLIFFNHLKLFLTKNAKDGIIFATKSKLLTDQSLVKVLG
jgi:hypothetical protein